MYRHSRCIAGGRFASRRWTPSVFIHLTSRWMITTSILSCTGIRGGIRRSGVSERKHGNRIDRHHHLHQEDFIDRWSWTGCIRLQSWSERCTLSGTTLLLWLLLRYCPRTSVCRWYGWSRKKGGGTRCTMSSHSSGPGCYPWCWLCRPGISSCSRTFFFVTPLGYDISRFHEIRTLIAGTSSQVKTIGVVRSGVAWRGVPVLEDRHHCFKLRHGNGGRVDISLHVLRTPYSHSHSSWRSSIW